jgi:hypothetical protein
VDNASSSNPILFFTKISVSFFLHYISYPSYGKADALEVDLAAELGIPNVPRGEPESTKGISFIANLETRKAEEVLGLTRVISLKDVVATGGGF